MSSRGANEQPPAAAGVPGHDNACMAMWRLMLVSKVATGYTAGIDCVKGSIDEELAL